MTPTKEKKAEETLLKIVKDLKLESLEQSKESIESSIKEIEECDSIDEDKLKIHIFQLELIKLLINFHKI